MGLLFKWNRPRNVGTWSGMVALVRTVVGVSLVGGLLVVLLWSEQQVGVKTPAHTHFHAHARGIPPESPSEEDSTDKEEVSFRTVTERLEARPLISGELRSNFLNKSLDSNSSPSLKPHTHTHTHTHSKSKSENVTTLSFHSQVPHDVSSANGERLKKTINPDPVISNANFTTVKKSSSMSNVKILMKTNKRTVKYGEPLNKEETVHHNNNSTNKKLVFKIDHSVPASNYDMPKIYVITPTYRRPEQVAELTRLSQTLMLVPNLHWLVAEDSVAPTRRVLTFLDSCNVPHTYLLATASRRYKGASKPRGVSNRNAGLKWLKVHAKEGVFYFADDDNTYDYRIFHEMRWTKRVSMFPVGLVTRLGVSSPIVSDGKLIGFYDGWIAGRKFPVDMAGFAVNVQFYLQRESPMMPYSVGFEEDGFLKALKIKPEEVEPLAENCTKILVWHTRTVKSVPALKMPDTDKVSKTNLNQLKPQMVFQMPYGLS